MERMLYQLVNTKLGWVGIAGTEGKISKLELPRPTKQEAAVALESRLPSDAVETDEDFSGEASRIVAYFAGEPVDFKCELSPVKASSFDLRVWNAAREIGYGEVQTYGWIADRIGQPNASRAVGQALGRNPILVIIPCHRVLRSDGGIGGFGSGLEWKRCLLDLERNGRR